MPGAVRWEASSLPGAGAQELCQRYRNWMLPGLESEKEGPQPSLTSKSRCWGEPARQSQEGKKALALGCAAENH